MSRWECKDTLFMSWGRRGMQCRREAFLPLFKFAIKIKVGREMIRGWRVLWEIFIWKVHCALAPRKVDQGPWSTFRGGVKYRAEILGRRGLLGRDAVRVRFSGRTCICITVLIGYYDYHPVTKSPKIGSYDCLFHFITLEISPCDYFLAVSRGSHNIR